MKLSNISVLVTAILPVLATSFSGPTLSTARSIEKRDLISTILDEIEDDLTCDSGEVMMS